tara:strand:+ start:863 stop:1453 length:591 start_codon:yes stop_codon:yes gene_type:complete
MKKLLIERFQELAGIRPLYQIKKRKRHILESIFDKVADMVKGKSDGEQAAIDALKKFNINIGKDVYSFGYGGGQGTDGGNAYYCKNNSCEGLNVPQPVGSEEDHSKGWPDLLRKAKLTGIETIEGKVMATLVTSVYNFKSGKFEDEETNVNDVTDTDQLEKELDIDDSKHSINKIYTDMKMIPYEDSSWKTFVDKD